MNLQKFLDNDFIDAQQRLNKISEQIDIAVNTLIGNCDDKGQIPYHLSEGQSKFNTSYSQSTHAMVLHALAFVSGRLKRSKITAGRPVFFEKFSKDKETTIHSTIKEMSIRLKEELFINNEFISRSKTYGENDPLTMSWIAELISNKIIDDMSIDGLFEKIDMDNAQKCFKHTEDEMKANDHPFPVLRKCIIFNIMNKDIKNKSTFLDYFMTRLHKHLSLAAIPDSRFDPAELVFCLEGALSLDCRSVDSNTLDRILDVLCASQEKSAYWRPVAPMLFTIRGAALYPLSIEVVNAMLRICTIKDKGKRHGRLFARIEPMIHRYYDWMSAQMVTITPENKSTSYSGWHSENISDKTRIDVWETSQILLFLQSYGALLREQVSVDALLASGLKVDTPKRRENSEEDPKNYWAMVQKKYEPFNFDGYKVYEEIGKHYVDPRASGGTKRHSMVLYGPPGTGKSTIPEELSKCLNQPMITVTISDFLADGAAQTEQRAKALFQVLEAQRDVIILFDEIDHFILDRESKIYRDQDSVFQFMPPGMLTKLLGLRRAENCIFILATNFKERLDAAAIRLGRIDDRFLVMPPDRIARKRILKELAGENSFKEEDLNSAAEKTPLYIYNEIKKIWDLAEGNPRNFCNKLIEVPKSIRLSGYRDRLKNGKNNNNEMMAREEPLDEYLLISHYMLVDAFAEERDLTTNIINKIIGDDAVLLKSVLLAHKDDLDQYIKNDLIKVHIKKIADELCKQTPENES